MAILCVLCSVHLFYTNVLILWNLLFFVFFVFFKFEILDSILQIVLVLQFLPIDNYTFSLILVIHWGGFKGDKYIIQTLKWNELSVVKQHRIIIIPHSRCSLTFKWCRYGKGEQAGNLTFIIVDQKAMSDSSVSVFQIVNLHHWKLHETKTENLIFHLT